MTGLLAPHGVHVEWASLKDWQAGKFGRDATDALLLVETHDLARIADEFAVMTVLNEGPPIPLARKRTFCIACSDWVAHCSHADGVLLTADRIIFNPVDSDVFFPAERQRTRAAPVPVVLHACADADFMERVAAELAGGFTLQALVAKDSAVPDAMRQADVWLSLAGERVMQAMATDLVVVTTDVGVFWQPCGLSPDGASVGGTQGVVTCDWTRRTDAAFLAACVRLAWQNRAQLRPRAYVRRWYGPKLFGQKWVEAILEAAKRFGLAGAPAVAAAVATPKAAAPFVGHPPRGQRER